MENACLSKPDLECKIEALFLQYAFITSDEHFARTKNQTSTEERTIFM